MKTLVTGGAGFIGSAIARALLERGDEVRVLDNFMTGFESNVPPDVELVRGDLRDLDRVTRASRGVELVFHQAAFKSVPKSVEAPLVSELCNSLGTLHVLIAAKEAGVRRVVYASSSSVYGESSVLKREDMPTVPISPYGVSKLAGEHYCRVWTKLKGLSTVSLRYFNVFGPGQHPDSKYSAVFPAFISALESGTPPQIFGDGTQSRDFTFVGDVVRANLLAADARAVVDGAVINICAGFPRTVNEVLESIFDAVGTRIDPVHLPRRTGDILHSHGDPSRAASLLMWRPQADWNESVRATAHWFLSRMQKRSPNMLKHLLKHAP